MRLVNVFSNVFFTERVYTYSQYVVIKLNEVNPITSFTKITIYFILFVIVLLFAYYFTKFISIKTNGFVKGKNLNIIEVLSIGKNNRIIIVKANSYVYILSIGNNYTTVIDKIPYNEFNTGNDLECNDSNTVRDSINFNTVLKSVFNRKEVNRNILKLNSLNFNKKPTEIKKNNNLIQKTKASNLKHNSNDEDEKNE